MFDNAIGCMEFCCAAFALLAACRMGLRITLIGLRMIEHLRRAEPTSPRQEALPTRLVPPSTHWVDQRRAA